MDLRQAALKDAVSVEELRARYHSFSSNQATREDAYSFFLRLYSGVHC